MRAAATLPESPALPAAFARHRTLLLNADYQPLGYPLETLSAEDTVRELCLGRYVVVEWSQTWARSPTVELRLPSVVALAHYIPAAGLHGVPACTLHNVYVRDGGLCQYTGVALRLGSAPPAYAASLDHVVPRARGGGHGWGNVVLASWQANNAKGHRRLEDCGYTLATRPWVPTGADLLYLWLTQDRLSALPAAWHGYLQLKPTARLQRALQAPFSVAA